MASLSEKIEDDISIRKYGENLESELYISLSSDREQVVRIHSPESLVLEEYYDVEEIDDVINLIKEPKIFLTSNMEYRNFSILYQALVIIAETM